MATKTYKDGVKIEGNLMMGKTYRGNGRWAKVISSDYIRGETITTVAFGEQGEYQAKDIHTYSAFNDKAARISNRRWAQEQAMTWVIRGI